MLHLQLLAARAVGARGMIRPDMATTLAEASRPRAVRRLIMNSLLPVAEDEETTLHRRLHSALRGADHPDRATGAAQSLDARAAWTARDFLVSPDFASPTRSAPRGAEG